MQNYWSYETGIKNKLRITRLQKQQIVEKMPKVDLELESFVKNS